MLMLFVLVIVGLAVTLWRGYLQFGFRSRSRVETSAPPPVPVKQRASPRHPRVTLGVVSDQSFLDEMAMEKLREFVPLLADQWETLFRYGDVERASSFLKDLSPSDRIFVLLLAIAEGRWVEKRAAIKILRFQSQRSFAWNDFLSILSPIQRLEIEKSRLRKRGYDQPGEPSPKPLNLKMSERIQKELCLIADELRVLDYEELLWVLVPPEPEEECVWVEASHSGQEMRIKTRFVPDLTDVQRYELLVRMRKAQWVLEVHNHPPCPDYALAEPSLYEPSSEDIEQAIYFKRQYRVVRDKMKFFVVTPTDLIEYSLPGGEFRSWRREP